MLSKTTRYNESHTRIFINVWIVTFSLFVGFSILVAAVLAGWPVFINLLAKFSG